MLSIVLYQPEIPPNTGNVIRLCANTGASLHLIRPLGFSLDDKQLQRAGLDYHEQAIIQVHDSLDEVFAQKKSSPCFAFTTKSSTLYTSVPYPNDAILLFGPETRGLPSSLYETYPQIQRVCIPQQRHSRSLNLSNAVAVGLFEAWRQHAFAPMSA